MADVQVPATQGTATPAPQAQPQSQGPWANDLAFIEDESIRSQVSEYLGTKVQPYITQLEQRAKPALDLYDEFQNEPGATTLGVIEEVYGEDAAKTFAEYLTDTFGNPSDPAQTPATEQPQSQTPNDPRLERMLSSWERDEQEREWKSALSEFQEAHKDVEIDDLLFRPFAAMTDGDLDQALVGYRNFLDTAREKLAPGEGGTTTEETVTQPPPALGTQGGQSPVPAERTGQSIGEAISDWVNDLKAQGQPVAPPDPNA
jgi:hypothetical protein